MSHEMSDVAAVAAEPVERRARVKGNARQQNTDAEPGSRVTSAEAHTATRAVTHPRQEPYAGKPHVRIWAGGVR